MPTANVTRVSSGNPDAVILPVAEWKWSEDGQLISSTPGTWCRRPDGMNKNIVALFSCPNCHGIRALVVGVHTVNPLGRVEPDLECGGSNIKACSYHRLTYLDRWNRKPLYACALELWDPGVLRWTRAMIYTHAEYQAQAQAQIGPTVDGKKYRIVAIAPAIGVFVTDGKDDTKLSADAPPPTKRN